MVREVGNQIQNLDIVMDALRTGKEINKKMASAALETACIEGRIETVAALLAHEKINEKTASRALKTACFQGERNVREVVKTLLACDKVDPSANNDAALKYALYEDDEVWGVDTKIVKMLIKDPRVDEKIAIDWAKRAYKGRHVKEFKMISREKKVRKLFRDVTTRLAVPSFKGFAQVPRNRS